MTDEQRRDLRLSLLRALKSLGVGVTNEDSSQLHDVIHNAIMDHEA
jgi:hypothetical protein